MSRPRCKPWVMETRIDGTVKDGGITTASPFARNAAHFYAAVSDGSLMLALGVTHISGSGLHIYRRLRRLVCVALGVTHISRCGLHICRRTDGSLMSFWASPTSRDVG